MPAATAAAEPPLDPPAVKLGSHGLAVDPWAAVSEDGKIPNSDGFVFPKMIAAGV